VTIAEALRQAKRRLRDQAVRSPNLAAEVLLRHTLERERVYLFAHPEEELSDEQLARYWQSIEERAAGKPTQYITGIQEFYGREFRVTPDVMIPRPETEFVVETVLKVAPKAGRLADVGSGSGAIAVTLQLETGAELIGTDVSAPALRVASGNARNLASSASFVQCDLLTALGEHSFDVVASNPPYVPQTDEPGLQREVRDHEPRVALYGGGTGLDFYRRLIEESPRVLRPGGWLVVEFGIRQLDPVRDMLGSSWANTRVVDDLAGLPRVLATRYSP
jgi:release factor glutamine methyltransferase